MEDTPKYLKIKGEVGTERFNEFKIFRYNLAILRASTGLNGIELAEQLCMPKKRIHDFETGRCNPNIHELKKIGNYLQVTIDELLYKKAVVTFI
jgi:transcriptional regulator with XRE-family HTH domain